MRNFFVDLGEKLHQGACYIGLVNRADINHTITQQNLHIQWINPCRYGKEGWFADPFILSVDEQRIVILAEEYHYADGKGRLVELVVDRKSLKIKKLYVILSLDTHLSFPIIWRENGSIYVYPENGESGSLTIWEYDSSLHQLVHPRELLKEPLADSQIVKLEETYYLFAVKTVTGTQDDTKNLSIYSASSLFGPYQEIQVISNVHNEERGAGEIFMEDGRIIRPAQCCEHRYGEAVIFYELVLKDGYFEEREISRLLPDEKKKNGMLLHTYNCKDGVGVVDGYDYIYPIWRKIFDTLLNWYRNYGFNHRTCL